jgi:hypothetical protein
MKSSAWTIHPWGGGLYRPYEQSNPNVRAEGPLTDQNFISVDSTIQAFSTGRERLVSGNFFRGVNLLLGYYSDKEVFQCNNSSFENVRARLLCEGAGQFVKNVTIGILDEYYSLGNVEYLVLNGSGSRVEDVRLDWGFNANGVRLILNSAQLTVQGLHLHYTGEERGFKLQFDGPPGTRFIFDPRKVCKLKESAPRDIIVKRAEDLRQHCE